MSSAAAIWHEVECGGYEADMALWERLAARYPGPILDVGSGTGRVALRLATAGASVVALDHDVALLAVLEERAGLVAAGKVTAVAGDAREFVSEERFGLVIVAMQTIQLFGGADERLRFLRCARGNVAPGGCVAIALADLGR
ncbi:MAG: class I SAM-dependent methyltransferase, partial [Solirubrobacterales bacterium]